MADDSDAVDVDDDESKIVTKFLLNTCRLLQPTIDHMRAGRFLYVIASAKPRDDDDDDRHLIPLLTGSLAEFYIQPMLSCVGDIDIMAHRSDMLAIPNGYPPPTELPAEFNSRVEVSKIIDSEYPGYVYLVWSYLLTEDSDTGKYNAVRLDERQYVYCVSPLVSDGFERHGPAATIIDNEQWQSIDAVRCVRCLSWPSQAADWPTRHRNYDWPDSATVDHVVRNGCDVVNVAHRLCRQDEWMARRSGDCHFHEQKLYC